MSAKTTGNKVTVMVHVDALRHDYVSEAETPFLNSLAKEGLCVRLIPPFGFEPDDSYFTGTYPEDYEGGVHFTYSEKSTIAEIAKWFPPSLDNLHPYAQYPFRRLLEMMIGWKAQSQRVKKNPFVGYVPFRFLKNFDFKSKWFADDPQRNSGLPTIYDYLRREAKQFLSVKPFVNDCRAEHVVPMIINKLTGRERFIYVFISDLDAVGHKFGPMSPELTAVKRLVDAALKKLYETLAAMFPQIDIFIFGDHGMVSVDQYVDMRNLLQELKSKISVDYIYFLDSTFARFWFRTETAKKEISELLMAQPFGRIFDDKERERYRCRFRSRAIGDMIFWLHGGAMIFPNFWHVRNKKKGMHGYRDEVTDNHAAFIYHSTGSQQVRELRSIQMVDLFQSVMRSLEIVPTYPSFGLPIQDVQHE